ncbi:MAG: lipopolysaccharide biosynthesis protein [Acidobacteriota bacterium]
MSGLSDVKRVVGASGLYAAAAFAQKGLAFLLLPVYTRYIPPAEYGALELLNALSAVLFGVLLLGLPSAITKCYHRDAESDEDKRTILGTAVLMDLPVLGLGVAALAFAGHWLGETLIGLPDSATMIRLMLFSGLMQSLLTLALASFRAREKAAIYSALSLVQFVIAGLLNVTLVVVFELGVFGVLWGNLIAQGLLVPVAFFLARNQLRLVINRRLVRPMLTFGTLLIPAMLAGWVTGLSDRWVLKAFRSLEEVAVYGVGYKVGMVLHMAVVWPFQLAWPAFSFSISRREGHEHTYATTLTWLCVVTTLGVLGLSLLARTLLPAMTAEGYDEAYRVVPPVALAYALGGIHYCMATGVHLAKLTRYLPIFSTIAAALNLGLNLIVVPRFGMMGATWSTVASFTFLAAATSITSARFHPAPYEWGRLVRIAIAGGITYTLAVTLEPTAGLWLTSLWHLGMALLVFPALLGMMGFLRADEIATFVDAAKRLRNKDLPRGDQT